jgi:hypothetical protein
MSYINRKSFLIQRIFLTVIMLAARNSAATTAICVEIEAEVAVRSETYDDEVTRALNWVSKNGHLDLLAIRPTSSTIAPIISGQANAAALDEALRERKDPYSQLVLTAMHPEYFPNAIALQRDLALEILKKAFDHPPVFYGEPEQEKVLGALATLYWCGKASDAEVLSRAGKWAEFLPKTFELVAKMLKAPPKALPASAEQRKAFVQAVFDDTVQQHPEFEFFISHSDRVAKTVVELRNAAHPDRSQISDSDLGVDVFTHDFKKTDWPPELISKTTRLNQGDFARVTHKFREALKTGLARENQWALLTELNRPISASHPLQPVNDAQRNVLEELKRNSVITEEEARLLSSPRIAESSVEREQFNQHFGGYRTLVMLGGNNLGVKLAQLHHERLDGSGYPFNLTSETLMSKNDSLWLLRAIAVADVFDAMTNSRPNSPLPMAPAEAIRLMTSPPLDRKFDQEIVRTLAKIKRISN